MGVNISKLVPSTPLRLNDLAGKAVAIDAFNTLYQFLTTIRQPDGTPLKDRNGRVTSHLSGLLNRNAALIEFGLKPVYVFDGRPPELKEKTLKARREAREAAQREWEDAIEAGDMKRALTKASQSTRLDDEMIDEARTLLDALAIPWVDAPGEGEAQMAFMTMKGDVWAGASQDFDSLLFGTPTLIRNLTLSRKRRVAASKTADVSPELIELEKVLASLHLTREQLVDMGILVGTDFNEGVHGIGPKRALKMINELGTLERISAEGRIVVPHGYEEVRRIFLEPEVTEDYSLSWPTRNEEDVRRLLCDNHGFSVERVDSVLTRLRAASTLHSQSSLDRWRQ
ncbi:MAG: flap endonuclease-1 [Methanobacteriota archaeon]|nr:MAG: flap endonuclease-1 [Euryarchaeota archaeon]